VEEQVQVDLDYGRSHGHGDRDRMNLGLFAYGLPLSADPGAWVGYASHGRCLLGGGEQILVWQPPDLADPGNPLSPRSQLGSHSPYLEAYRGLAARTPRGVRVEPVAVHEPVTVQVWRSGGVIHVLAGNLESRWLGDSRFPRRATVILPLERLELEPGRPYVLRVINADAPALRPHGDDPTELRFQIPVPPEGCVVARLEPQGPS
jgi:hypothetical protein